MSNLRPLFFGAVIAAAGLMSVNGVAYATTGSSIIGHSNSATSTTTIHRTTHGAALSLKVRSGSAPLKVNSTTKVVRLNADLLDGKNSSKFQRKIRPLNFTPIATSNGWTADCFGTGTVGIAKSVDGTVHLQGGICTTAPTGGPFTIPAQYRPSAPVYLTVDECNATTGRILIAPDGSVEVDADPSFTPAQSDYCFTSLAGVSYTLPY